MIINNTSVRGFFLYSELVEYEAGDFVVEGDIIYVCSPQNSSLSVIGERPSESKHFYMYLGDGDQMSSVDDFVQFVNNEGGKDKYISLATLIGILNNYCKGINTSGIIGEGIDYTVSGDVEVNISGGEIFNKDSVLSDLMLSEINHGVFKVSRELPEIELFVPYILDENNNSNLSKYCILKQYTYLEGSKKVRVQELIDHEQGDIFYRTAKLEEVNGVQTSSEITDWTLATNSSKTLRQKAENLIKVYKARIDGFTEAVKSINNCFCFYNLVLHEPEVDEENGKNIILSFTNEEPEITEGSSYRSNQIIDIESLGPITLNLVSNIAADGDSPIYESNSITIDLALNVVIRNETTGEISYNYNSPVNYKVRENLIISSDVKPIEGKEGKFRISIYCNDVINNKLVAAYYRKYHH